MTWALREAVKVHLLSRNLPGVAISLLVALVAVLGGLHREVFLPFSLDITIDLPPFTPFCYTFTAVLLASPRLYGLEHRGGRESVVRLGVLVVVCSALVLTGLVVAAVDGVGPALVTLRNGLFFLGAGLLLCRVVEPALAALVAAVFTCLLAFFGTTPDGDVRTWAWLLLDAGSLRAAALVAVVLVIGLWWDVRVTLGSGALAPEGRWRA